MADEEGWYLPEFMRDFHDGKGVFKTIHASIVHDTDTYLKNVDWVAAHVYTVDKFLWWAAQHGYTLQRCRRKKEFRDVYKTLSEADDARREHFAKLVNQHLQGRKN